MINFRFASHQSDKQFMKYSYFESGHWEMVKVIFYVKIQGHIVYSVSLGLDNGKVIRKNYPDPYFLCSKYKRSTANSFDGRGNRPCCGGGRCGGGKHGRNELKTCSHPGPWWLYNCRPWWLNEYKSYRFWSKSVEHVLPTHVVELQRAS